MAEIHFNTFGFSLLARLGALNLTQGQAVEAWPGVNKALMSRATRGMPISAGNYLHLCRLARLDPYQFYDDGTRKRVTLKSILKQAVTATVSREASARS